jgi:hypothetical protein
MKHRTIVSIALAVGLLGTGTAPALAATTHEPQRCRTSAVHDHRARRLRLRCQHVHSDGPALHLGNLRRRHAGHRRATRLVRADQASQSDRLHVRRRQRHLQHSQEHLHHPRSRRFVHQHRTDPAPRRHRRLHQPRRARRGQRDRQFRDRRRRTHLRLCSAALEHVASISRGPRRRAGRAPSFVRQHTPDRTSSGSDAAPRRDARYVGRGAVWLRQLLALARRQLTNRREQKRRPAPTICAARENQQQLRTGCWMRPPLPIRADRAGADQGSRW